MPTTGWTRSLKVRPSEEIFHWSLTLHEKAHIRTPTRRGSDIAMRASAVLFVIVTEEGAVARRPPFPVINTFAELCERLALFAVQTVCGIWSGRRITAESAKGSQSFAKTSREQAKPSLKNNLRVVLR